MKKNILIILWSLKHWWWAEKIASIIWSYLNNSKKYNVIYLTFYQAEKKYDFSWKEICLCEKLSSNIFINFYKLFQRAYKIKQISKKENIDICLSHMEEANFSNIFSKIIFFNKSKIYIQIHQSVNAWWKLYKILIKLLYNFADKIITIVKEEKENLIKNYNIEKEKIEVIYNLVDIEKIDILKKESLWEYQNLFQNDKFTFINIWRLTYPKNQELLIEVFKNFNKKYKNVQLIILWEWELRAKLEKQIWENKNIYLLWNQKNPYKFLYNSDCFVFTSRYEWFWIVITEAMSCDLPIISTDCHTWPKEILKKDVENFEEVKNISLEEYGILVPIFDEDKYYEAMKKIYLDENLKNHYKEKSLERSRDFEISMIMKDWKKII